MKIRVFSTLGSGSVQNSSLYISLQTEALKHWFEYDNDGLMVERMLAQLESLRTSRLPVLTAQIKRNSVGFRNASDCLSW